MDTSELGLRRILKQYWGFDSFRSPQLDIIKAVLNEQDVFALLPTGGGKSLCYQLPSILFSGLTIVISPLIALMKDQVSSLKTKGIPAESINSSNSFQYNKNVYNNIHFKKVKALFISPEKFCSDIFQQFIKDIEVSLLVIDEAHCVSQWGHDFRPAYLTIGELSKSISAHKLALTATANEQCQQDIFKYLNLKTTDIFRSSFLRSNISFSNYFTSSKRKMLLALSQKIKGSKIVYVRSRRMTHELAFFLNSQGVSSLAYNAGMSNKDRSKAQSKWSENKIELIVATNAFGMGIDKGDVTAVIHYEAPPTLEDYYQEAGRAGRNGQKSYAIMLLNEADTLRLKENFKVQFPEIKDIKIFYRGLMKFLKIPLGSGVDKTYVLNLRGLSESLALPPKSVYYYLQQLSKLEIAVYSTQFFHPTQVFIIKDKRALFELYENKPEFEELLQVLLRNYEGLFTDYVRIDEEKIANKLSTSVEEVIVLLKQMHHNQLIQLKLRSQEPSIRFSFERVPQDYLEINHRKYQQLKDVSKQKMESMIRYINGSSCRQEMIMTYLDDPDPVICGSCDICLGSGKSDMRAGESELMLQQLKLLTMSESLTLKELLQRFPHNKTQRIKKLLNKLTEEEMLIIENGFIKIKA